MRHRATGVVVRPHRPHCANCAKSVDVEELTLIDKQYHVPPSGCTDGDYWTHSEYAFRCPHCNVINRLLGISHERDRWAAHAWAPREDGGARYARGERCSAKKCRSIYTPLLEQFAKREELCEQYDGEWVNNHD